MLKLDGRCGSIGRAEVRPCRVVLCINLGTGLCAPCWWSAAYAGGAYPETIMTRTFVSLAAVAALLAACGGKSDDPAEAQGDTTAGPAVSSSEEPRNEAVDTTPTTGDQGQTPGANSFTQDQAKGAIESAGYTN